MTANAVLLKSMTVKQRMAAIGFETDTPVCGNCIHFCKETYTQRNGVKERKSSRCSLANFNTKAGACCDRWTGKKGEGLVR